MKIKFLGTGGAFDFEYGNSSAIIECNDKKILIDCGHTVFPKLMQLQLVSELDYILITHLHDDHVGSLSTLIFYLHFFHKQKEVILITPKNFQNELINFLNFSQKNVLNYITIEELPDFIIPIDTFNRHYPNMQTYGYIFSENDHHIVYSGDINDTDFLFSQVKSYSFSGKTTVFHDITFNPFAKNAHAYYKDIERYIDDFEIWGYHCNPKFKPADCQISLVIENSDFLF